MTAITFPSNPTVGDSYTSGTKVWQWDGKRWMPIGIIITSTVGANLVVTSSIQANAVVTAKIADSAVTTAKIADGTVTSAKLAAGAGMNKAVVTGYNLVFGG